MSITWILVANASRARLLHLEPDGAAAEIVEEHTHDASRAKASELLRDNRSPPPSPTPPKEVEAEKFARVLADRLRLANARNEYDDLVLVASPEFLGILRSVMDSEVAGSIRTTVAKDYTRDKLEEVVRMVGAALQEGA